MRIAHVCPACGSDLSRRRAPPDPVYALPIVACPGCGAPSVRRSLLDRWHGRSLAGLPVSLGRALGATLMVLVIVGASIGTILLNASALQLSIMIAHPPPRQTRMGLWLEEFGPAALGLLLVGPVLAGLVLRWALPHLRSITRVLVWLGGVVLLLWVVPNLGSMAVYWLSLPAWFSDFSSHTRPRTPPRLELGTWLWPVFLGAFASVLLVSEPLAERFGRSVSRRRLRGRLARARRRRMKGRS